MSKYNFIHLHNHTEYSLLDGMMKIEPMIKKAKSLGMNSCAITDHGNLYGAIEFYQACEQHGVKPIIGSEFYMTPFSRSEKSGPRYHLTLLAKSEVGYKNLLKLSSKSFIEGFYYKPRIDKALLEKYNEGIICLSGCLQGLIPNLILEGKIKEAENEANYFKELFGKDSFFLEIQIHGIKEERIAAKALVAMSKNLQIPFVATNDAHYLNKDDAEAHDVLLCIGTKRHFSDSGRMKFHGEEFYFKTEEEMESIFKEVPKALSNTQAIAEMCELKINLPGPQLPEFDIPEGFTKETYLKDLTEKGCIKRYKELRPEIKERLDYELEIINKTGFPGYFLIVWDFIRYAKENKIWVGPGRGSGAGSIVAYALEITNLDPLKYGLLFERFLNQERVSMPDFDIDFCKERRQEVINYVTEKYSQEKVCQIVTFSKMKAKAVLRDVGRVLEIPLKRVDEIAKMIEIGKDEDGKEEDLKKKVKNDFRLKEIFEGTNQEEKRLLDISIRLEGLSRHTSMHAAGVVIGQKPITEFVPLQVVKDEKNGDFITTQFPGPQLESCGLVKMDFLGLITLTLMRDCVALLEEKGITVDVDNLPLDDQKVYEVFAKGETDAVFQFESPGMKKFLKKLKPTCLDDLIAMNALYRPGPMNFIDSYILRKHGKEKIEYDHPLLENILKETYGIMIYQEQVMKIAQVLAGYTLGSADILRRAMGKKKIDEMKKHEKIFVEGCAKHNGINEKQAKAVFDKMSEFANYGFNKSHAAAYAYLAYQCAYLKRYHPADFMASVLTSEINKPDKLLEYIDEIKNMGLVILPPDVNYSSVFFTVENGKVRYAMNGIKGVGESASLSIINSRKKEGSFKDFAHFLQSVDLRVINRAVLEILIQCGGFDSFGQKRKWMYEHLDDLISSAQSIQQDRKIGQWQLFDTIADQTDPEIKPGTDVEEWDSRELMFMEKDALGFFITGNPLKPYYNFMKFNCTHSSRTLGKLEFNENSTYSKRYPVVMAGILDKVKVFREENGNNWAIAGFEDFHGKFTANVYSNEYKNFMNLLIPKKILLVRGEVMLNKKSEITVIAKSIEEIELKNINKKSELHVYFKDAEIDNEKLFSLKNDLNSHNGELNLFFHIVENGSDRVFKVNSIKAPKDIDECMKIADKYKFIEKIKAV